MSDGSGEGLVAEGARLVAGERASKVESRFRARLGRIVYVLTRSLRRVCARAQTQTLSVINSSGVPQLASQQSSMTLTERVRPHPVFRRDCVSGLLEKEMA
jgi:hypothetical protein